MSTLGQKELYDEIDRKKEVLIGEIEARLKQSVDGQEVFALDTTLFLNGGLREHN